MGFNPLPARRPGATVESSILIRAWRVSILSQPEGRELPLPLADNCRELQFQSSPSPKAGSYIPIPNAWEHVQEFQSSPSPKAGSYVTPQPGTTHLRRFNPLPARRPGATSRHIISPLLFSVSILSQPEGRELRRP